MRWLHCLKIFCVTLHFSYSQDYRLPETVIPSKYVVDIVVPEGVFTGQNETFSGSVVMTFTVSSTTSEINLHHRDKNITSVVITSGLSAISISSTSYNSTTQIYTIATINNLTVGSTYDLELVYNGILETDAMNGFYISTYADENNKTSYLVLTKFEPVHTRHAFPCIDEPQYKATFAISLTYPTGLNALGNTPIANSSAIDSTYTKTYFEESTIMSSYLVAFAISHFTCTEGYTIATNVSHSVCSRPEEEPDRKWAVDFGTSVMRTLESITGIKYGSYMLKMDQLAIPDFAAGAMENWGLVGYREAYLLWSENDSSNSYKKSIALVVAHEFTHMWYGNLVTCKWWDYLFLNEGFARYYQYFASAATKETIDWELEKHFNVEVTHAALLADSTSDAAALTSTSLTRTEVTNKFSTISYDKGAAILRMIEKNIMGADNFVYGLRQYLSTYSQQAATPANLWSSLANYTSSNVLPSGVNFSTTINNWIELAGHPVVIVTRSGDDLILSQQRFLLDVNSTTQYYIPITYTVSSDITAFSNTTVKAWLAPDQNLTLSGILKNNSWVVLNNRQAGFYRVDYDNETWAALKSQLHSNYLKIDVLNRAQLVSDAYNFARAGTNANYRNWLYSTTLDLLRYLQHEEDYYPWYAAIVGSNHLLQRLGYDTTVGKQFTTWMLGLMSAVNNTISFETLDSSNQVYTMKQVLILTRQCKYEDANCIRKVKEIFANYRDNGVKVNPNLRSIIYCNALRYSDDIQTDFNFLWQKYTETKLMTEVLTILRGIGCTQDITLLKWFLSQTINSTSGIRLQDFTSVWSYVYGSSQNGTNAAIEYITDNYAELTSAYSSVGSLISNAANYIYTEAQVEKLEALMNITEISDSHKSRVESALSTAKSRLEWIEAVGTDVKNYLDSLSSNASISKSSVFLIIGFIVLQKFFF